MPSATNQSASGPTSPAAPNSDRLSPTVVAVAIGAVVGLVLAIVVGVVLALIGLPWWLGPIIGLIAGAATIWYLLTTSFRSVMDSLGATSSAIEPWPRYANLADGLSLSIGVTDPDLRVINDPALNAVSLAKGDEEVVIVTSGLLEALDRMQLEGVIAELLVRIKSGDAEQAIMATGVLRPLLTGPLQGPLGGLGARLLGQMLPEDREMTADLAAVSFTRFPPGLGAALSTIAQGPFRPSSASTGNDHLWLAPPLDGAGAVPALPLAWRIDTLLEI